VQQPLLANLAKLKYCPRGKKHHIRFTQRKDEYEKILCSGPGSGEEKLYCSEVQVAPFEYIYCTLGKWPIRAISCIFGLLLNKVKITY
jgi:hypothetical protein